MPREDVAARLRRALDGRDDLALAGLLDPRVRLAIDTGDASGGEWRGRAAVTRELLARLGGHPDASLEPVRVNGGAGLALRGRTGAVLAVLSIDLGDGERGDGGAAADEVQELWLCASATKLAGWNRRRPEAH
ncbi:hypothetical protein ACGGZK_18945 [Agromyces sp. MMS24-K17]|uniref:hypothetical protein n=1 Tax=Agromyces sp. MMS24-K17 TaxID=3372850 RepID=UPI003753EF82